VANDRDMLRAARLPILIEVARLNIVAVKLSYVKCDGVIEKIIRYPILA